MSSAHCSLIVWSALDAAIVLVLVPLSLVVAPTPPVCPDDKPQLCAQAYNALAVALVGLSTHHSLLSLFTTVQYVYFLLQN